jgi:hypothetical protein
VVGVAALGADRPPPPGFLVVIALATALSLGTWWLSPRALSIWDRRGVGVAIGVAGLVGVAAGALGLVAVIATSGGTTSGVHGASSRGIGYAVVLVGADASRCRSSASVAGSSGTMPTRLRDRANRSA